jgi:hypothetical protein
MTNPHVSNTAVVPAAPYLLMILFLVSLGQPLSALPAAFSGPDQGLWSTGLATVLSPAGHSAQTDLLVNYPNSLLSPSCLIGIALTSLCATRPSHSRPGGV